MESALSQVEILIILSFVGEVPARPRGSPGPCVQRLEAPLSRASVSGRLIEVVEGRSSSPVVVHIRRMMRLASWRLCARRASLAVLPLVRFRATNSVAGRRHRAGVTCKV